MRAGAGPRALLTPARALARLVVPVTLAIAATVLGWAAAAPIGAVRAPGPAPVDALVALGAALACAGLLAVAAVGATVTLAVTVTGKLVGRWADLADLLTPHVVRAAMGLVVGVTVVGGQGCLASGSAHPGMSAAAATSVATTAHASVERPGRTLHLPPGWSPDRPAAEPHREGPHTPDAHPLTTEQTTRASASRSDAGSGTAGSGTAGSGTAGSGTAGSGTAGSGGARQVAGVVVQRGDTLWDIAARHLGPGVGNAQVAAEWPRWHAANRSTIGPDPNLILPGQRLRIPDQRASTDRASTDRASTDREESP